jgi:hypothetical protein
VPFERPRPKRSRRDFFPPADPRRQTAFVHAVFIALAIFGCDLGRIKSRRDARTTKITVRCVSFVADVCVCLCAVPGTLRGLRSLGGLSARQRSWDFPFAVFFRPTGECVFRRLAPAVVLALGFRGTRIWPRDPMLRIEVVTLATWRVLAPRASCADVS